MGELGTNDTKCCRKVLSERKVVGAIRSLISARGLQLECVRVLLEELLMRVLLYGSETMIYREKEGSRIRAVQMDNLRGLLGIWRMDRVMNAWIRELREVAKGIDKRINESVWFGHNKKMENARKGCV